MKFQFISKIMFLIICACILTTTATAATITPTHITKTLGETVPVHQVWTDGEQETSTMQPWIKIEKGTAIGKWSITGTITFVNGKRKAYNSWGGIIPGISEYWGYKAEDSYMRSADLVGEFG